MSPSTITRLVEKLEDKHLARRVSEGKSTLVFPTPASVALDGQVRSAWSELYRRYVNMLGEEAAHHLTTLVYNSALKLEV